MDIKGTSTSTQITTWETMESLEIQRVIVHVAAPEGYIILQLFKKM